MRTVNTSELTGEPLNWAVGQATGLPVQIQPAQYGISARVFVEAPSGLARYRPVIDWGQCGPLLDKFDIDLDNRLPVEAFDAANRRATYAVNSEGWRACEVGLDNRTAICRAVVAAVSGPVVDVPGELF